MKLEQAAREVIRQHSMECLSDKTVDALREALAKQATVSDGLCGGCAKKAADGWALYCVECWEQAEQEPVAFVSDVYQSRYTLEWNGRSLPVGTKLYAAPVRTKDPCHPWQDLTDDEIAAVTGYRKSGATWPVVEEVARAVIAKDREKNK